MEFTYKNKEHEIKFNYLAYFKANKLYSTLDDKGNDMKDGAATLFNRLLTNDDTVLFDLLKVYLPAKATDDDILKIIDDLTDDGENIDEITDELKDEMKNSGFFSRAIKAYIKMMEKGISILKNKDTDQDSLPMLEEQVKSLKEAIS